MPIAAALLLSFAGDDPRAQVALTLDEFHRAAAAANGERYFGMLTEDAVFIGTDAGERWSVAEFRAYAEPYFDDGQGWTYVASGRHINLSTDGSVAWFDERLQNEKYGETRGSGVLELVEGGWKIAQYNLSFPVSNDHAKAVVTKTMKLETVGKPRGEQLWAEDGERTLAIWNKVVPKQLELPVEERPVVVFLPSATFSARGSWDFPLRDYSVMSALAARGFDVFAVDTGGYGLSSPPAGDGSGGAASAAHDVLVALDFIAELRGAQRVILVGHSWGSQVAGLFAIRHPERLRGLVLYGFNWQQTIPEEVIVEVFGDEIYTQATRSVERKSVMSDFIEGFNEKDVPEAFATHLLSQAKSVPTGALRDYSRELPIVDPLKIEVPVLMLNGRLEFELPNPEDPSQVIFREEHWRDTREFYSALTGPRHWAEIPGATHSAHLCTPRVLFQRTLAGWMERLGE